MGFGGPRGNTHPNPMYDYFTALTPRRLKELFKLAQFVGINSAHIYGVLRKFGEIPITRLVFETVVETELKQHEKLFNEQLRLCGFLTMASFDLQLTGNSIVTMYEPIQRDLICTRCHTPENIEAADYSFNLDKTEFRHNCRKCSAQRVLSKVKDSQLRDPAKIRLLRLDPLLVDIDQNRTTGETEYYYTIPRADITKVRAGVKLHINHTPIEVLQAMRDRKVLKLDPSNVYHMRKPAPAGLDGQWGLPPLVAAIKLFMFAATLRRANEAIALEYVTPFRVIHPMAASGQGDPISTLNLGRWKDEIQENMRMHRRDPLRAMFAPIPIGVQNIGGDGRALLTLGELQEAEKSIILSLGVPYEFAVGGMGRRSGEVDLRMIENQLRTHTEDLNGLVQWVERRATTFLGWKSVPTKLVEFKLLDDLTNKQLLMQLWQAGAASETTVSQSIDLDLTHELDLIKQEKLNKARSLAETEIAIAKQQASLSASAQRKALMGGGGTAYDQQQVFSMNTPLAQEIASLDPGSRKSRLIALEKEDRVAYAVVMVLLADMERGQGAPA